MGEGSAQNAPDFSEVQSRDAAAELAADGKLVKMLLFPAVFGGEDIAHNTVYVTPATGDLMDQITGTLVRFFEEGLIDQLSVSPTYRGDSFVPGSIVIKAWHTERDGSLEHTIEVW